MKSRRRCNEDDGFDTSVDRRRRQSHRLQRGRHHQSSDRKQSAGFSIIATSLQVALKACRDNPGELGKTPNCVNANEARNKVTVQEMKDALK